MQVRAMRFTGGGPYIPLTRPRSQPSEPAATESGLAASFVGQTSEVSQSRTQWTGWIRPTILLFAGLVASALALACGLRIRSITWAGRETSEGDVQLSAVRCHTAQPSDACHSDVMFVKNKFLKEHPDWYRGLSSTSSFKDIQNYLSTQKTSKGKSRCPPPCDYTPPKSPAPSKKGKKGSCHTAQTGEDCYNHVQYTSKLIDDHPDWYGGLTRDSPFKDIQAYLHEEQNSVCPMPCGRVTEKVPIKMKSANCSTAVKGEACWDAIHWVLTKGYKKHPEWFKGISGTSTPEEVQNYLAGRNGSHCSQPACHCHTALPGENCYTHVSFTVKALPDHPNWYPGLTQSSSVKEVQAFMHGETTGDGKRVCPMPCGLNHDKLDKNHHRCHTAAPGESCYDQVLWAMSEVDVHAEWYPGLNASSSVEEFQALLHLGKKDGEGKRCPIPCDEEAMEEARNNSEYLNCHIAERGEPCFRRVMEAREGLLKHPKKYSGLHKDSTFEDVQAWVHDQPGSHCDQMPCRCRTAVKGDKCYKSISWVLSTGLKMHRDRFSMLTVNSTRSEVQKSLHAERQYHCWLPCTEPWEELEE